jgi:hypothetical protein
MTFIPIFPNEIQDENFEVSIIINKVSQPSLFVEDKTDVTPVKHKRRQKKVVRYFDGDKKALLESIQIIFPSVDPDWDWTTQHYNKTYSQWWRRLLQTAKVLKTKFQELLHSYKTSGGTWNKFEKRVKEIKHELDQKHGIIVNESSILGDSNCLSNGKFDISQQQTRKQLLNCLTRLIFEKQVVEYMQSQKELTIEKEKQFQKQHKDQMNLFYKIFLLLSSKSVSFDLLLPLSILLSLPNDSDT